MNEKQTFEDTDLVREKPTKKRLDRMDLEHETAPAPRKPKKGKSSKKKKAKARRRRRIILIVVLGILLALLIAFGIYLYWILKRPADLFTESVANVTEAPRKELMTPAFDLSGYLSVSDTNGEDSPDASPGKKAETATAAPQIKDNIVNIMLMGIDAFESGGTTSGTQPHTDVMMVVAVNFDKDTVDLITLPRDIFTTAPGYYGFYKLNGVFNAGGGMDDLEGGFALACRAAEIWMGGITIPYYYALDFQAVVDVVDAIGGIDYDVDQPFRANKPGADSMSVGKRYEKGMQHLDGNAVLGYLRIRHSADGLDSSRTARQRRMMVAIYKKLKTEGKLSQVPDLINAANSGVYTNTTLAQTTSLVNYAMNTIESDQIRTRAMSGDIWYQHYFKYCFVDQQHRLDLIKEVFGIDAEPIGVNTPQFENWLYDIGFESMKFLRQPEKVFQIIQDEKNGGKSFTDAQIAAYAACYQAYAALDEGFAACSERMQKTYVDTSLTEQQVAAIEAEVKDRLSTLNKNVKDTTEALQDICGTKARLGWNVGKRWFVDRDINEKFVAFG